MSNQLKRLEKARDFPVGTCPASRHAALCAEELIRRGSYIMCQEDPQHIGGSIAATVAALWEARRFLRSIGYTWSATNAGTEWVKKLKEETDAE